MRALCSLSLPAVVLAVLALAGCDLLLGPPPAVEEGRGGRNSEGEGEEGEGEEGEGEEGEGEPNVPPDVPPHPLGPNIQSFSISRTTLTDTDVANITVVVTDADGVEDIVGPLLIEPVSGTVLGPLTSEGAGTFTASVSWSLFAGIDDIEFVRGNDARFVRVQFSDNDDHAVSRTERLTVTCNGEPACDNRCGAVRCAAQGNACAEAPGPISDDDLCAACNSGCTACEAGCACFNDAPRCNNGSDCLQTVSANSGQVLTQECTDNGGLRVRDDGFLVWSIGGEDVGVALDVRLGSSLSYFDVAAALCAPFGGLDFNETVSLPNDLRTSPQVFALEPNCTTSNLATACEPILGPASENPNQQGNKITCVNPIGGGGGGGVFGGACDAGDCPGDMFCDVDDTCQETCSQDLDCGSCAFDNPEGCHCEFATGRCAVGPAGVGGFNQPCDGGTFGSCNSFDLFCDNGTCRESCSFSSDCNLCTASGASCTCDGFSGTCTVSGGGGTVTHNTGLGGTFTNNFPIEMTREAAIRACNAHFGVTTCVEVCSVGSGSVTRDGTCSCSEPFVWVYAGSGTHTAASAGQVTRGDCSPGIVGNWN